MQEKKSFSPLRVNVVRGKFVESTHSIFGVAVDSSGQKILEFGNSDQKIFPRSSIKSLQAIPILTSGAADRFGISDVELALACASHSGEEDHVGRVESWLKRVGLSNRDLECGAHAPARQEAALALARSGKDFHAAHNNCSGKHTGMLCTALCLGEPTQNYVQFEHPVQKRIQTVIEDFCGIKLSSQDYGIDGCSIPTFLMPLSALALGIARLGNPTQLADPYQRAAKRIVRACIDYPLYIAGTERYCTKMTSALQGKGFVKVGAEGVMIACLPELRMGIALKCTDGNVRGVEVAMSNVLNRLGLLDDLARAEFLSPKLINWNKIETGYIALDL